MSSDFVLSDKSAIDGMNGGYCYLGKDVKEFIKKLKEEYEQEKKWIERIPIIIKDVNAEYFRKRWNKIVNQLNKIDKLAGDKLI